MKVLASLGSPAILTPLFVLLLAATPLQASRNARDHRPLYSDSTTEWQILKGVSGSELTSDYASVVMEKGEPPAWVAPPYVRFMYEKGSPFFFRFSLIIPPDVTTYWTPSSELVLRYVCGKDTLSSSSNLIFFTSDNFKQLYFSYDFSEFAVPNPVIQIYSQRQVPAVFARFDFKKEPDYLLSCTPRGVRSKRR